MATYFTCIQGVGLTNLAQTVTHSLSITPANLFAQVSIHQVLMTGTNAVQVQTVGTNIVTVSTNGTASLVTCDVFVWQQHSLVS